MSHIIFRRLFVVTALSILSISALAQSKETFCRKIEICRENRYNIVVEIALFVSDRLSGCGNGNTGWYAYDL